VIHFILLQVLDVSISACLQISPEEEINLNDEPEVKVEAAEAKLEAGREVQSSTLNTNPEQTPSSSPGVMQYLFGCLPCVGNPK